MLTTGAAEQFDLFSQTHLCAGFTSLAQTSQPAPKKSSRTLVPGLSLSVLGSGSGGNCSVLRLAGTDGKADAILVDAGFGPRRTARKLAEAGLGFADIRAVCVTHFDRDHFKPTLIRTLVKHEIPIFCHHWHLPELTALRGAEQLFNLGLVEPFGDGILLPMPGVTATTTRLQHDLQGTIAFRFTTRFGDIGYATDLGHAPRQLIEHFAGVDLLCIESNYDHGMTIHSSRPSFVNRRNLSDSGHLSNEQAFEAVQQIADRSPHGNPRRVVLLHRSSQCNHPTKVRRVFEQDPALARRVIQTQQRRRTRWFGVRPLRNVQRSQLCLASARD